MTRSGRPSREALETLEQLATDFLATRVVVLPVGFSVLAYDTTAKGANVFVQPRELTDGQTVDLGGASILFPALVACLEHVRLTPRPQSLRTLLPVAVMTTLEWIKSESGRILAPKDWNPSPDEWKENRTFKVLQKAFRDGKRLPEAPPDWVGLNMERATAAWGEAHDSEVGVITAAEEDSPSRAHPTRRLELWRGMIEVDGYVCCEPKTRSALARLARGIQTFSKTPRHQASCLLVADPGSGKTFLARQLARAAKLEFLPFNITQMRSKGDVLECFDTIVAKQAENPNRRLLVFIDEINTSLDGTPVYGMFLTPLDDGHYVRNGRVFNIEPCMWVFAGTDHPSHGRVHADGTRDEAAEKGSDFVTRLTLGDVDLSRQEQSSDRPIKDRSASTRGLENVYLGATLLIEEFPDVRRMSELVLRAFWELPQHVRIRDLKHFVRRFRNIQYGQVTAQNVPTEWPGDDAAAKEAYLQWDKWRRKARGEQVPDVAVTYSDEPNIEIVK